MTKETGGPAFPSGFQENPDETVDSLNKGMTLRDYFAAKALQPLLQGATTKDGAWHIEAVAAYEIADAMLKAREA